jgi:hypothetical protein
MGVKIPGERVPGSALMFRYILNDICYNTGGHCAKHNAARENCSNKSAFDKMAHMDPRRVYNRYSEKYRSCRNVL